MHLLNGLKLTEPVLIDIRHAINNQYITIDPYKECRTLNHIPKIPAIMKTLAFSVFLFTASCAFSQNGRIAIKNPSSDSEDRTNFIYEPPGGIYLPEDLQVNISCSDIRNKSIPLEKKGSVYEFSMKLPPKSTVMFFAVSDKQRNTVHNNSGKGYVVYLKDPDTEGFGQTLLEEILSSGLASYYLKLDYNEQDFLDAFDSLFASYPDMKNGSAYTTYLMVKFRVNKEGTRPELLAYAEQMAGKDDEESLSAAFTRYRNLQMHDKMDEVAGVVLEKYPKGEVAKNKFLEDYYSVRERDGTYISNKIDEYIEKFGNPQDPCLDMLYYELLFLRASGSNTSHQPLKKTGTRSSLCLVISKTWISPWQTGWRLRTPVRSQREGGCNGFLGHLVRSLHRFISPYAGTGQPVSER